MVNCSASCGYLGDLSLKDPQLKMSFLKAQVEVIKANIIKTDTMEDPHSLMLVKCVVKATAAWQVQRRLHIMRLSLEKLTTPAPGSVQLSPGFRVVFEKT